jgi:hypothetical protein
MRPPLFVFGTGYAGSFWGDCSAKAPPFFNKKSLRIRGSFILIIFVPIKLFILATYTTTPNPCCSSSCTKQALIFPQDI